MDRRWRILASPARVASGKLARLWFGLVILAAFVRAGPVISDRRPNAILVVTDRNRVTGECTGSPKTNQESRNPGKIYSDTVNRIQIHLRNPRNPRLFDPLLVEIDQIRNACDVIPIGDSHFFLSLIESLRERIAIPKL